MIIQKVLATIRYYQIEEQDNPNTILLGLNEYTEFFKSLTLDDYYIFNNYKVYKGYRVYKVNVPRIIKVGKIL